MKGCVIPETSQNGRMAPDSRIEANMEGDPEESPPQESEPLQGDNAQPQDVVKLKKELGLMEGVAIVIGIVVGSGIFISPRGVLQEVRSIGLSLALWVFCGLLSTIGALCYAELGTAIPKSGGDYAYIFETLGPLPAFLYLWDATLIFVPTTNAIMSLTFANYILQPFFDNCVPPDVSVRLIAGVMICLLTFLNCYNVRLITRLQDGFMFFKVMALVVIIVAGAVFLCLGHLEHFHEPMKNSNYDPGHVALAFYAGIYSYAGWNYLNFVTEELKNPYVNLPRAIWISMPTVTLIYCFANVAYFVLLSPLEILSSSAVAVTFGSKLPTFLHWIMPISVAGTTLGSLSVHIYTSARICFVGAREGHFPESLAMVSVRNYTPTPALVFMGVLSLLMLITGDVYALITYATWVESVFILMSVAGLLRLRKLKPDLPRPIRVHTLIPVVFLVICAFLVVLPVYVSPAEVGIGIAITITGIPGYYLLVRYQKKPAWFDRWHGKFTRLNQKIFLAMPEDKVS